MRRRPRWVVILSLLWAGACAAPAAHLDSTVPVRRAQDTMPTASKWREMTWSEYYTRVMQDAFKHGAMVIWVDPPPVHAVDRTVLMTGTGAAPR